MNAEWYWSKGLHDAKIISVETVDLQYDYTQRKPLRNYLQINLDASGALFDYKVKFIRLYNFKVTKGDCNLTGLWWLHDELCEKNGKYILKICLRALKCEKEIEVVFEKAEVVRN